MAAVDVTEPLEIPRILGSGGIEVMDCVQTLDRSFLYPLDWDDSHTHPLLSHTHTVVVSPTHSSL